MSDTSVYDRRAASYDRVIGSALYNRLVWSTSTGDYASFAERAVADAGGPYLDAGCGTLVFTAGAYRAAGRELVLTDLSPGMLEQARRRLVPAGEGVNAEIARADLFDLPFDPGRFQTVGCFAMLHCIENLDGALASLAAQLAPGGRLFTSALVCATRRGRRMLALLHRSGEVAEPRSADRLAAAIGQHFELEDFEVKGCMAYGIASSP